MNITDAQAILSGSLPTLQEGTLLIEGPTLVGKTSLIRLLKETLGQTNSPPRFIRQITCSQSHAGYEPLLDPIEELLDNKNWAAKNKAIQFAKINAGYFVAFVAGVFHKYFPDAITKESIEQLRSKLDGIFNESKQGGNSLEFPRSDTSKLLRILGKVVKKSGQRLYLFIDRIEELPTPGIKLLQMLAECPVENVIVVLCANTESTAYAKRTDIRELTNVCKRTGSDMFLKLEGYSAIELQELRRNNGYPTSIQDATIAYNYSLNGRIGLIHDWLTSETSSPTKLKSGADQLSAHYAIEYDRLPTEYKDLIKALGAIFPSGISIKQVAALLNCEEGALEEKLSNIKGTFAVIAANDLILKDNHVLYFLRKNIEPALIQIAYENSKNKLQPPLGTQRGPSVAIIRAPLTTPATSLPPSLIEIEPRLILAKANEDLARGATQAVLTRLDAWRIWRDQPGGENVIEAEFVMAEADALGQLGIYEESIEKLESISATEVPPIAAQIALAEKYLRVGNHTNALRRLSSARRQARREGEKDLWAQATSRTLSVRNDLTSGNNSSRLAIQLSQLLQKESSALSPRTRCLAYRAIARSLALNEKHKQKAQCYAKNALEIALTETKSQRDEGNSRYALADAFRHAGDMEPAIAQYQAAEQIAISICNEDLRMYSLLGLAACHIRNQSTHQLSYCLTKLNLLDLKNATPEKKLLDLFACVAARLNSEPTPPHQAIEGRPWTMRLSKILLEPDSSFKSSLNTLVIIL